MTEVTAPSRTTTLPAFVAERIAGESLLRNAIVIFSGSLLLALSAQVAIPIPFSPVPLTLQPLAVLLLGAALGPVRGCAAVVLYLLEGMSGLPVFAQGRGGIAVLAGPTAGYLLAFPFAAWIAGWVARSGWTRRPITTIPGMAMALAVIHLGGWSWLAMTIGAEAAFVTGVAPFLVNDVVKVLVAALLLPAAEALVARFGA
ncbi:MAG TPA: biotin transporter BioY [Thermoanaerobaculia bacterium]|nr:biotin transporter BioY [Thermoanaerobaculia bacterium]